jgi:hypothetical protein
MSKKINSIIIDIELFKKQVELKLKDNLINSYILFKVNSNIYCFNKNNGGLDLKNVKIFNSTQSLESFLKSIKIKNCIVY